MKQKVFQSKLSILLNNSLKQLGLTVPNIVFLEHPADIKNGDYSINTAMILAKETGQKPNELAEQITKQLNKNKLKEIKKIESTQTGFINFYLSREFFSKSIDEIINADKNWGKNKILSGKKIMVEYTDPNPFKEFHIGHLMSNTIGESISRLIEFSGAEVKRANYYGDVGLHVAKAIWGKMEKPNLSWGEAYAYGSKKYDENKETIDAINKKVYDRNDDNINILYDEGKTESIAHFENIYKKLGTKFDFNFPESSTWKNGEKVVKEHGDIFEESEGAIVFKGEKYGLHTRVFITSEGLPTYEAKELGLAKVKYEAYPYDVSIIITASEINEYFKVLFKAMELVYPELAKKTKHIGHGFMKLPSGKMSSREGDIITGETLISYVESLAKQKTSNNEVSSKVAVGAIKYSILKQSSSKDIVFDFEKSLSFEGASGPYLQYSHTRAESILNKAKEKKININTKKYTEETTLLERLLYRFPEVVERATKEYEPHYVTTYLTELASAFNNFYAVERIIDDKKYSSYKVALTKAFQITMKNGLWILGIKTPSAM